MSKYSLFILQSILTVQALFPTLKGESKRELATTLTGLAAGILGALPNDHAKQIGNAITVLVPVLQATGVMAKDQPPADAVAPKAAQ